MVIFLLRPLVVFLNIQTARSLTLGGVRADENVARREHDVPRFGIVRQTRRDVKFQQLAGLRA